jgi:hypothetical protein
MDRWVFILSSLAGANRPSARLAARFARPVGKAHNFALSQNFGRLMNKAVVGSISVFLVAAAAAGGY